MRSLAVAGAGMAGLVAAARARDLGAEAVVYEKGDRPGGSMLLSSSVVWRFHAFEDFRAECPEGDRALQRLVWERLGEALEWLESLGAEPVWTETENPRTTGRRYDPRRLTERLARAAGDVRLGAPFEPAERPLVLATGGFPVRLARERGLLIRSNLWSEGEGLDFARTAGAALGPGMEEFYGRAMPAPPARITESDFVPLAQLYGRRALAILDERGESFFEGEISWSENDLAQAIAYRAGGRAWYLLDAETLGDPDVAAKVEAARAAGGTVVEPRGLPFEVPERAHTAVHVAAGVTHTIGGVRVDERARVLRESGSPIDALYAAGVDVGGIATGGYASGLAQALVLGLVAAESAVAGV